MIGELCRAGQPPPKPVSFQVSRYPQAVHKFLKQLRKMSGALLRAQGHTGQFALDVNPLEPVLDGYQTLRSNIAGHSFSVGHFSRLPVLQFPTDYCNQLRVAIGFK